MTQKIALLIICCMAQAQISASQVKIEVMNAQELSPKEAIRDNLQYAFLHDNNSAVREMLVKNRWLINEPNLMGHTPLGQAVLKNDSSFARFLLKHDADSNAMSGSATPLMLAAQSGEKALFLLLLEHGANPYIKDAQGKTALDILKENYPQILQDQKIQKLINKGHIRSAL